MRCLESNAAITKQLDGQSARQAALTLIDVSPRCVEHHVASNCSLHAFSHEHTTGLFLMIPVFMTNIALDDRPPRLITSAAIYTYTCWQQRIVALRVPPQRDCTVSYRNALDSIEQQLQLRDSPTNSNSESRMDAALLYPLRYTPLPSKYRMLSICSFTFSVPAKYTAPLSSYCGLCMPQSPANGTQPDTILTGQAPPEGAPCGFR